MAVGDNLNDVEMLDFAGTAVVMGNATDAIKQRGYRVTGTNDEEGWRARSNAMCSILHHGGPEGEAAQFSSVSSVSSVVASLASRSDLKMPRIGLPSVRAGSARESPVAPESRQLWRRMP